MIELSQEQQRCADDIYQWAVDDDAPQIFYVTGVAGSGKSTVVMQVMTALAIELELIVLYCAFTGKAALVMRQKGCPDASTIHKLIYLPAGQKNRVDLDNRSRELYDRTIALGVEYGPGYDTSKHPDIQRLAREVKQLEKNAGSMMFRLNLDSPVSRADIVVVDEVSMVDNDLGRDLMSFGTKILVLGDPGQLPPVAGEGFFTRRTPDFTLSEIHRQAKESPILVLATQARLGQRIVPGTYGSSKVITAAELTADMALAADQILCGRNKTRHKNNARMRQLLGYSGHMPMPGEKLVCLRNNHEKGLLNGSLWTVVRCSSFTKSKYSLTVKPEDGGLPITVLAHKAYMERYGDAATDEKWIDKLEADVKGIGFEMREAEAFVYGSVLTVHKCVHPDTRIQTQHGLVSIKHALSTGSVATGQGAHEYTEFHTYPQGKLLRITTDDGYSVTVTPEHKLMAWSGKQYEPIEAQHLAVKQFLRLRMGDMLPTNDYMPLPAAPETDVRAMTYVLPELNSPNLCEFLGLMVADGTLFRRGFRLVKRHQDVVERFSQLTENLFGCPAPVTAHSNSPAWQCEKNSTYLADWLRSIGGLCPNAKDVPECVMQCDVVCQGAFLRGLFEDGSVSKKDHTVELVTHAGREFAEKVQLLLLRQGIIASIKTFPSQPDNHTRIRITGRHVKLFADKIGFIAASKQDRLRASPELSDMRKKVPDSKASTKETNWRSVPYTSRELASNDMLDFHHDRIALIEETEGPSMCLTVPEVGRFLQNGFDGCNSQGSQWNNVLILDESRAFGPDSNKHLYTAITRAAKEVTIRL